MSDTKSFRYNGGSDDYNIFKADTMKSGMSVEEKFNNFVNKEVDIIKNNESGVKTTSRHQDDLTKDILESDLSEVVMLGKYHVRLDKPEHIEFITSAGSELADKVRDAVRIAVYTFWIRKWSRFRGIDEKQADVYYCNDEGAKRFYNYLSRLKITFSCDIIPMTTLSNLIEDDLNVVVQFDCTIIGPSPKKLEVVTGRYIQKVLIQEPEDRARDNNPVVIKSVFHGEDTMNVSTGQKKRIVGIYNTAQPTNGDKVEPDKTLQIDVISVKEMDYMESHILSKSDLEVAKEAATTDPDNYLEKMIGSFCPKIYGRRLEKLALYLSLLGGSEFPGYRRESHVMLIGEADSGKSELVKFADKIANTSSIVDGSNATGVGVLFALDDYDGMKILRSGAMILNNGGHIIVDEYDKMPKPEQKKFNQAMEQQRATYNKGGHVGNAECKTTVITACNPKNERWVEGDIIDNMPFDPSTITRFDIIIKTQKETHENEIRAKMEHIMKGKRGKLDRVAAPEYVKGLLNHLRGMRPTIEPKAEELLINKFVEFTQIEQDKDAIPIQTRQMEGIQRLSEAYAKLMFKDVVDCEVVEKVIVFYQECLATLGMNVSRGVTQFDMSGRAVNRDKFFEDSFKNLELESSEGFVYLHEFGEKLMESDKFGTTQSVESYIEKRVKQGYLYEPKPGVFKRQ